jgi:hypothetical protein
MKLEEVNKRTKEAIDFSNAATRSPVTVKSSPHTSGQWRSFHIYSFGNIPRLRPRPAPANERVDWLTLSPIFGFADSSRAGGERKG